MAKFRKKPVVIEAVQLRWDTWGEVCKFVTVPGFIGCYVGKDGTLTDEYPGDDGKTVAPIAARIPTLEGVMEARQGDWIIKEPFPTGDRQFYPCKPDIFEKTYEALAGKEGE